MNKLFIVYFRFNFTGGYLAKSLADLESQIVRKPNISIADITRIEIITNFHGELKDEGGENK